MSTNLPRKLSVFRAEKFLLSPGFRSNWVDRSRQVFKSSRWISFWILLFYYVKRSFSLSLSLSRNKLVVPKRLLLFCLWKTSQPPWIPFSNSEKQKKNKQTKKTLNRTSGLNLCYSVPFELRSKKKRCQVLRPPVSKWLQFILVGNARGNSTPM